MEAARDQRHHHQTSCNRAQTHTVTHEQGHITDEFGTGKQFDILQIPNCKNAQREKLQRFNSGNKMALEQIYTGFQYNR